MTSAHRLLFQRRYNDAVELLSRQLSKKTGDDREFVAEDLGVGYLLAKNFSQARTTFQNLISATKSRIATHFVYLGLVHWVQHEWNEAIRVWKAGIKCGYARHDGADLPMMLYFASVLRPGNMGILEAKEYLQTWRDGRLVDVGIPYLICGLLLEQLSVSEFEIACKCHWKEMPASVIREECLLHDFYKSVWERNQYGLATWGQSMVACAVMKGIANLPPEWVVAVTETDEWVNSI